MKYVGKGLPNLEAEEEVGVVSFLTVAKTMLSIERNIHGIKRLCNTVLYSFTSQQSPSRVSRLLDSLEFFIRHGGHGF